MFLYNLHIKHNIIYYSYIKWGSFPIINPKNDSTLYPSEIVVINKNAFELNLKPNGNVAQFNFRPLSGDYFINVMLMNKRNVIKKVNEHLQ